MRIILVLGTVVVGLCSSLLLDFAAEKEDKFTFLALVLIGLAFVANLFRFLLWGAIHKRYEMSKSYPLTASFFPLIFIVSLMQGETVLSWQKIMGVVMIVLGLLVFEQFRRRRNV